jgi:hypothetical protein
VQYRFIALDLGDDIDIKRLMQEKSSHIEYIRWEEPFKFNMHKALFMFTHSKL